MKRKLNIQRLLLLLAVWLGGIAPVWAQSITLEVQPNAIRLNESATLKLNFSNLNPPQAPNLPPIDGFDTQFIGQEQHFQFINGQQERRLTFNYHLQPRNTGRFTIGPFTLDLNGQKIEINPVEVEVLPPSGAGAGTQSMSDLIFAKINLPRPEVFLQERFDVELAIYYQGIQIDRNVQLMNLPGTGLNLEDFEEVGGNREVVNNQIYEVRRFRMRGTAITAGAFELAPTVRVNVMVRRERTRDPFFGDFDAFFGRYQTQPLNVPATPMTVTIRPLPTEGRPEGFGGAVGNFDMDVQIQPRELSAGEPVTLTLRIAGRGNFENISMPPLNLGDDFRSYDPKLIAADRDHKVFEQVFIPRSDAVKEIPPVQFSYFDPAAAKYQTITRGPYPLLVKPGAATDPQLVQAPALPVAPDRTPLGIDIIDLKRTLKTPGESPDEQVVIQPGLHLAPLLALAALLVFQRRREAISADVSRQRRSQAPRSARRAIKAAEDALARNDAAALHQSLWQALADYTAHRCNLEAGQISPDLILNKCRAGGLAVPVIESLEQLLRECDEARFAAGGLGDAAALKTRLQKTREILRAMENVRLS